LELDRFWEQKLERGREAGSWAQVPELLVVNRLIEPGSEFRWHRQWFDPSAMDVLLAWILRWQRRTVSTAAWIGAVQFANLGQQHTSGAFVHAVIHARQEMQYDRKSLRTVMSWKRKARSNKYGSLVTATPPSPAVMVLLCCRLKMPISPSDAQALAAIFQYLDAMLARDRQDPIPSGHTTSLVCALGQFLQQG
jgi:hypothetical protein